MRFEFRCLFAFLKQLFSFFRFPPENAAMQSGQKDFIDGKLYLTITQNR